jgi:arylsulfatase A-like enzyme
VPAGAVVDELVSLVDLAPTVLDLVGLEPEPEHWGRSLAAALDDDPATVLRPRVAPLELAFGRPDPALKRAAMEGLHAGDHKLIRNRPGTEPVLFDLVADPDELTPLELAPADPRLRVAKDLWRAIADLGARLPRVDGELPAGLEEGLTHFGYLGEDD